MNEFFIRLKQIFTGDEKLPQRRIGKRVSASVAVAFLVFVLVYHMSLLSKISKLENVVMRIAAQEAEQNVQIISDDDLQPKISKRQKKEENEKNGESESMVRKKRSKHNNEQSNRKRDRRNTNQKSNTFFNGCHLVPDENNIDSAQYISWTKLDSQHSLCFFRTLASNKEFSNDLIRYIQISKDGYYLVHAQLTFKNAEGITMGFQTILLDQKRDRDPVTLLTTVKKQDSIQDTSLNSGYHSGIFKLRKNQLLEVRTMEATVSNFHLTADYSYFGIVRLPKTFNIN